MPKKKEGTPIRLHHYRVQEDAKNFELLKNGRYNLPPINNKTT